jgi:ribosome maturation factor RimP
MLQVCEDGLQAVGYELVELEYVRSPVGWVLRAFIDHDPERNSVSAGITHDDCIRASRQLSAVLDTADPIEETYSLEVSSPGVRRPLRKKKDFERFSGRRVRVTMRQPIEGQKNFVGEISAVEELRVMVRVDDRVVPLPLEEIAKARLEVEF